MPFFFAFTLFVSASLLFLVQPMIAKMILPTLGGTPAVWNTCMVFFQAALLAAYAYAHSAPSWLGARRQIWVHALLLLVPFAVLPLAVRGWTPPSEGNPIFWLLALLGVSVGLPFLLVATSAPLLQRWFADSGHPAAKDPYFLYGASNLGSMLALLGYPTLVEPYFSLATQSYLWTFGYGLLVVLIIACGLWTTRTAQSRESERRENVPSADSTLPPPAKTYWRWVALGFVPSSLMLGVTTYFTTDIAAIPLLWVVPLAIYLLSFILVFARRQWLPHERLCRAWPMVLLLLVFVMVSGGTHQLQTGMVMALHLVALFVAAMVCHGELARHRPAPAYLTRFYLAMSLGGVLGGLFNALISPIVFTHVVEYPLALMAACLLLPGVTLGGKPQKKWLDFALPVGVAVLTVGLILGLMGRTDSKESAIGFLRALPGGVSAIVVYVVPLVLCFTFVGRPLRFGLGVGAVLLASMFCKDYQAQVLHRERGFFGDLHARHDPTGAYVQMVHGTTLHGMQAIDPARRGEALTYFHKTGPIGEIFAALHERKPPERVAITGLGVGVLATYAKPQESWTYYEIDPAVCRVARDKRFFTYLSDAEERGVYLNLILGDARLRMADAKAGEYDLLMLDAFSSDSVPVHLLTREALRLYESKLAKSGWFVFNISNRYLRLEPVLAALAEDAGLKAFVRYDTEETKIPGKTPSAWVVMARDADDLRNLTSRPGWRPAARMQGVELWTDDFSNLLSIFMW